MQNTSLSRALVALSCLSITAASTAGDVIDEIVVTADFRGRPITELPATVVDAERQALVAWISSGDRQAPLQAVGGYLPD